MITTLDRCDRCGAAGKVWIVLVSGGELVLCGHHGHKHQTALEERGARFYPPRDERPGDAPWLPAATTGGPGG